MDRLYKPNSSEIAVETFEDGTVMINFLTGRYYSFNPAAEAAWSALERGVTREHLRNQAVDQLPGGEAEERARAFDAFFDLLIQERLVAEVIGGEITVRDEFRDNAFEALAAAAPTIEVFDDLADLILLDPIHDVSEQLGWPVIRMDTDKA